MLPMHDENLGRALHALQDFYSHTNWIEIGNTTFNPNLANFDRTADLLASTAGPNERTCTSCAPFSCAFCIGNISSARLTSAYFQFAPLIGAKPAGKCSHGGTGDFSTDDDATGGINKDSFDCEIAPHSYLHQQATSMAKLHTKQFVRNIKDQVTLKQFKALLGIGTTLAFAIDTTGSMSEEIAGARNTALQILNSRLGTVLEPVQLVLVDVNDPYTNLLADTTDDIVFRNAINSLGASGGGDCPELAQSGLIKALNAIDDSGELILITDASAKDDYLAGQVRALAQEKGVQITTFATGSCSPIDPEYYRTASDTGGQVFVINPSEVDNLTALVDFIVRPDAVDVVSISDTLSGTTKYFSVPVDSTLSRVTFSVSGTSSVALKRPDGTYVQPSDPNVSSVFVSGGRVYSITDPAPGTWEVTVNGFGNLSLRVAGESSIIFSDFNFVEYAGYPGHDGYAPIKGLPIANQLTKADAEIIAPDGITTQFELRSANGTLIQNLSLGEIPKPIAGLSREYFGETTVPNSPFLVYARGTDANGRAFQRLLPGLIKPQTVKINTPPVQNLVPGQTTTYSFQVQNLGSDQNFIVRVSDTRGFVTSVNPNSFITTANGFTDVSLQLFVPAMTAEGTLDTITLTASSASNPDIQNSATIYGLVSGGNNPPNVNQARPSVVRIFPANHSLIDVNVLGITDVDGDPLTIAISRIMQDEPTNGTGNGNTCPDALINGSTAQLRAERKGNGNGRVYTISFTATDGRGGSSQGNVKVCVPKNGNSDCTDDGANFDSSFCPQ